jgi:hypothetical protein
MVLYRNFCLWSSENMKKNPGWVAVQNPGASQHEEERNAKGILQNAGCVLVWISVISLGESGMDGL